MVASDYHGIMRINEARYLRYAAEAMTISAIERKESRSGAARVRVDFPEPDNETGLRIIMVEMVEDELKASSKPTGLDPNPPQKDETT